MKKIEKKDFPEIERLAELNNHDEIIKKLQEILTKILLETQIKISTENGDVYIEPVLIEAYYYKKGVFEDFSVHRNEDLQKNHFGKLFIHRPRGCYKKDTKPVFENRGGIDLCLSKSSDYFFSVLIREAYVTMKEKRIYVNGPGRLIKYLSGQSFGSEKEIPEFTVISEDNYNEIENQNVLYLMERPFDAPVFNTVRIGLSYDRKAEEKNKDKERKKEKYVFALLGGVKGMNRK
ncbi:MAG: hypothetical protein J6Y36_06115 [Treponema sp.]|nr:hypothetical protein [Treponema sp.]